MFPSPLYVNQLIGLLRTTAEENVATAMADDDGGLGYCLGAALANDAADALEALLLASVANDLIARPATAGETAARFDA
jgi:hypothetical protein